MRKILHLLPILFLFAFTSCREEAVTPIRNVRFDPNLINKATDGTACTSYTYATPKGERNLGAVYTQQVLVVFSDNLSESQKEQVMQKYGFIRQLEGHTSKNSGLVSTVSLARGLSCKQVEQVLRELSTDENLAYVAPYFMAGSNLIGLSDEVIVTIKPGSLELLKNYAAGYKAEVLQQVSDNVYLVKVDKRSLGNTLDLTNYLQGKDGIESAEPDLIVSLPAPDRPTARVRTPSSTTRKL